MKLSAKFARQETEEARRARIGRRRISTDRADAIRRMLGVIESTRPTRPSRGRGPRTLACPECPRAFALPMHLGRHRKAMHGRSDAA
jgi:hypothetical protein